MGSVAMGVAALLSLVCVERELVLGRPIAGKRRCGLGGGAVITLPYTGPLREACDAGRRYLHPLRLVE